MLASVPHTGTFFLESFFRGHKDVAKCLGIGPILKSKSFVQRRLGPKAWEEGLDPEHTSCVQAHVTQDNMNIIMAFCLFSPMVVPLRDPLLALISTVERNPHNDPMTQVDAFLRLANRVYSHEHIYRPMLVPVDLLQETPSANRFDALVRLQLHCGLKTDSAYAAQFAAMWEPVNSAGKYPLKQDYYSGDRKPIWAALGREIGVMQAHQDELRPMLEAAGYKDLMWWD